MGNQSPICTLAARSPDCIRRQTHLHVEGCGSEEWLGDVQEDIKKAAQEIQVQVYTKMRPCTTFKSCSGSWLAGL